MEQGGRIETIERQDPMRVAADRFETEVCRIIGSITRAVQRLNGGVNRLCDVDGVYGQRPGPITDVTEMSPGLHCIAAAAAELDADVDAVVDRLVDALQLTRAVANAAAQGTGDVIRIAQFDTHCHDIVRLANAIDGEVNLLALNATVDAAWICNPVNDLATVRFEIRAMAGYAVRATEEIAWQIAETQRRLDMALAAIAAVASSGADLPASLLPGRGLQPASRAAA